MIGLGSDKYLQFFKRYAVHNNGLPKLFSLPVFLFTVNINSEEEEDSGKFENITNANLR